jgi:predicted membrane channel-forming protein YqfA (hemolysin III family)
VLSDLCHLSVFCFLSFRLTDHAAVFIQIGCACTPVALLVMHHMYPSLLQQPDTTFNLLSPFDYDADETSFLANSSSSSYSSSSSSISTSSPFSTVSTTSSFSLSSITNHNNQGFSVSFNKNLFFLLCNLSIVWIFGSYGIWHVFHRRGQRMKLWVAMIGLSFPSYPLISTYMTVYERCLFLLVLFIHCCGATIFGTKLRFLNSNKMYKKIANTFGYHEIFHLLTVLASIALFSVMNSLIQSNDERCQLKQWAVSENSSVLVRGWIDVITGLRITTKEDFC